ncbi:hypothetical protein BKA62DRAFT_714767 [Auriculariales sp. MPI-PUGE-AT-0066]|nr:hypothetical protein BKA62DRAFT_714767 [Auriculariales sp. MPI-PUGE-AT-0066]
MPSPLHGLNLVDPFPSTSHGSEQQLPADLAAQLDLWSTLNFSNIDDGFQPFSLGGPGPAPGTLDDLVRLGEEELQAGPLPPLYGTVDPFQVAPQMSSPPSSSTSGGKAHAAKKARVSAVSSKAVDEDDESDDDEHGDSTSTPMTAAEDKRRRNTAASARFRAKKKEREVALEKRAKELEGRMSELERECEALRRENGWLKGLVVGVTQAGGDLASGVPGMPSLPLSLAGPTPVPVAPAPAGSKRKRE